jgi:Tfp pilus assembly protein PilN
MQDINLLPQSEITAQTKVQAVRLSTILSIIFLILVLAGSGYILYLKGQTKKEITVLESGIQGYRNDITSMSGIEITVRNLDKKYTALKGIFGGQKRYSLLMEEIRIRKPAALDLENMDLKEGKINVNGSADNYISIAEFVNNLLNKNFSGGNKNLGSVFTSVSLNSVNMENSRNRIQFFIVVDFDSQVLK